MLMVSVLHEGAGMVFYTNYSVEDCIGLLPRKNIQHCGVHPVEPGLDNISC